MNLFSRLSALGAVLVLSTAFATADTIASSSATVTFDGFIAAPAPYPAPGAFGAALGNPTFNLTGVSPTWDAPFAGTSWVGVAPTAGPVGTVNPAKGYYLFSYIYTGATGTLTDLNVFADDTTSVWLNGAQIINPGALGSNSHCADNAPSCIDNKFGSISSTFAINNGDTIYFVVQQAGTGGTGGSGNPSGVDFLGTTTPTSPIPEPSTLLMLGTGLLGSAGTLMRKMRA